MYCNVKSSSHPNFLQMRSLVFQPAQLYTILIWDLIRWTVHFQENFYKSWVHFFIINYFIKSKFLENPLVLFDFSISSSSGSFLLFLNEQWLMLHLCNKVHNVCTWSVRWLYCWFIARWHNRFLHEDDSKCLKRMLFDCHIFASSSRTRDSLLAE